MNRNEKLLMKMYDPQWVQAMELIKSFNYDAKFEYVVVYITNGKRKEESFKFEYVEIFPEDKIITFIKYKTEYSFNELKEIMTDEIHDTKSIHFEELVKINKTKKFDLSTMPYIDYSQYNNLD